MSSGNLTGFGLARCASFVSEHESPEVGGESSLQAAECFVSGLAFGEFRIEVSTADAVTHSHLGDRDEMDR